MYVLAGLGNPGEKYACHRHNIGFMAIDSIASAYGFPPYRLRFSAAISEGLLRNQKILLCKPMTFMNLSGQSLGELCRFYKIPSEHVYVIHDDLDLEPGKIKLKLGGGDGGHNGLISVSQHIGKDYWRLRLGIGHPGRLPDQREAVTSYVLGNFSQRDKIWLDNVLLSVTEEADTLPRADPGQWLTRLAQRLSI